MTTEPRLASYPVADSEVLAEHLRRKEFDLRDNAARLAGDHRGLAAATSSPACRFSSQIDSSSCEYRKSLKVGHVKLVGHEEGLAL